MHAYYPAERTLTFIDAVVAIAITVLLLPLAEIELPESGVVGLFAANEAKFFSLVLSWTIIAIFWTAHHRAFSRVRRIDSGMLWLNFVWLLLIATMPLPTNLMSQDDSKASGTVPLYVGWMLAISLLLLAMDARMLRRPEMLADPEADLAVRQFGFCRALVTTAVFLTAFAAAFVVGSNATWVLLVLVASAPLSRRLQRRLYPAVAQG